MAGRTPPPPALHGPPSHPPETWVVNLRCGQYLDWESVSDSRFKRWFNGQVCFVRGAACAGAGGRAVVREMPGVSSGPDSDGDGGETGTWVRRGHPGKKDGSAPRGQPRAMGSWGVRRLQPSGPGGPQGARGGRDRDEDTLLGPKEITCSVALSLPTLSLLSFLSFLILIAVKRTQRKTI